MTTLKRSKAKKIMEWTNDQSELQNSCYNKRKKYDTKTVGLCLLKHDRQKGGQNDLQTLCAYEIVNCLTDTLMDI